LHASPFGALRAGRALAVGAISDELELLRAKLKQACKKREAEMAADAIKTYCSSQQLFRQTFRGPVNIV
jgi:uncharacterized protein YaaQ